VGKPPIVLVHGWCCDHTYFAPQIEHFASRGHSVVAVDLRGHGQSDKPQQQYTMQAFADDVGWMCEQLNIVKPVIVGHSMGGVVAFDIATRFPALPSAIVLLTQQSCCPLPPAQPSHTSSRHCAAQGYQRRSANMWRTRSSLRQTTHIASSAF
jgi:pimeloyl-ACP methyl ester carboxylesterase